VKKVGEEEEKKEYEWTILGRVKITTHPAIGVTRDVYLVTYVGEGLPPDTISIPVEEWTQEKEDKEIARHIHERLKFKPEVRRAPIP